MSSEISSPERSDVKTCADCGTTKTPLWRGGPAGPKVSVALCNFNFYLIFIKGK